MYTVYVHLQCIVTCFPLRNLMYNVRIYVPREAMNLWPWERRGRAGWGRWEGRGEARGGGISTKIMTFNRPRGIWIKRGWIKNLSMKSPKLYRNPREIWCRDVFWGSLKSKLYWWSIVWWEKCWWWEKIWRQNPTAFGGFKVKVYK